MAVTLVTNICFESTILIEFIPPNTHPHPQPPPPSHTHIGVYSFLCHSLASFDGTDDITRFPISKYAHYFNATWHSWPVNVPYISRHPCLWVTEKTPVLSDADVIEASLSADLGSERVRREKEEWGREWEELARSDLLRDYVHLPAHTLEELESLYSSPNLSKRNKKIVLVTQVEVSQIRRLIWAGGILPSKRGQIWIHLTDSWDFLNSVGLTEFDLHHEFLDHMHIVRPPHTEIEVGEGYHWIFFLQFSISILIRFLRMSHKQASRFLAFSMRIASINIVTSFTHNHSFLLPQPLLSLPLTLPFPLPLFLLPLSLLPLIRFPVLPLPLHICQFPSYLQMGIFKTVHSTNIIVVR